MNQEPDIVLSISGTHDAKGIVAVVIANALKQANVKNINHLNYDSDTFEQMTVAVNESNENKLSTANVLIVEFEEDEIDTMHVPTPEVDENADTNAYVGKNPNLTDDEIEDWKKNVEKGGSSDE